MAQPSLRQAPAFCLTDTSEREVCLSDYLHQKQLLLVLNRGLA